MPDSAQSSHPRAAQLAAFALGQLTGAERATLQAHLAGCPACRGLLTKALASLPPAAAGGESESGWTTAAGAGAAPQPSTVGYQDESGAPAALANHPRYQILKVLGQGGMGAVYQARHKVMKRLVALKVINAEFVDNPNAVERFHREVQAAAQLQHPNIVAAHDADQAGDTHFLVMEFVEGTDLARYVQKKGPVPVAYACHFIRQAALGLQHAHEKGMVHRDVKPHNLMLTAGGVVKVMDFGLARLAREGATTAGLTGENVLMGTADYIAPEQAQDAHAADIRADVYSLGCTLYHLLAGRPPFAGGSVVQKIAAHLMNTVPLAELPAAVPEGLRAVLVKMVAKDPAQRYQTPGEVAQALAPFVKKAARVKPPLSPSLLSPPPVAERGEPTLLARPAAPAKRGRGWPVAAWLGAGAVAVLLLGALAFFLAGRGGTPVVRPDKPLTNGIGMKLVPIAPGTFTMGSPETEHEHQKDEVQHKVTLTKGFHVGATLVTQKQWQDVMGKNPSNFKGDDLPVDSVTWFDAVEFCIKLSEKGSKKPRHKLTNVKRNKDDFIEAADVEILAEGNGYRLPTEAEWEYACRAGTTTPFWFGETIATDDANFDGNFPYRDNDKKGAYRKETTPATQFKPNRWGLHDMHGNLWQWCQDVYGDYPKEDISDPQGPKSGELRVLRGGSWISNAGRCRAACRYWLAPAFRNYNIGFRVVLPWTD